MTQPDPSEDKSREINEAARRYVASRHLTRSQLLSWLFVLVCGACVLLAVSLKDWKRPLLLAGLLFNAAFWWTRRRLLTGGWEADFEQQMLDRQREAGVAVETTTLPRATWWFWLIALLGGPWVCATMGLATVFPSRFQPLVFLGGIMLFAVLVIGGARLARVEPRPLALSAWWQFLPWVVYGAYALAVAAGLPQPLAHVPPSLTRAAWYARTLAPLFLVGLLGALLLRLDGYLQFRRLQHLVNDPPSTDPHGTP